LINYRESYAPNMQQRSMLSTTKLQEPCDRNYSHYRASIHDPTGQSQELCVKDKLLKFQLDRTVKEIGTFILRKMCSVGKWVAPHHMLLCCEILTCFTAQFGILHFYLLKLISKWFIDDTKLNNCNN